MIHCNQASPPLRLLRMALAPLLLAALAFPTATSVQAQPMGVSYTLAPTGQYVFWNDNAGLENGYFYGGGVGFGFGEFFELSGLYLIGNNFETNLSDLEIEGETDESAIRDALEGLDARDVDIRRYGGKVRINVGTSELLPFITLGSGILRFDPDGLSATQVVYGSAGAGITLSLADRYTLSVSAENLAYRYNPGTTFLSGDDLDALNAVEGFDGFNQTTVYNWAATAALRLYLGGRAAGELSDLDRALREQFSGGGVRIFAQPFYGLVDFNDALNLPDRQPLGGVNAGIDLGPYVGLRGFYWRATEEADLFDDTFPPTFDDLAMYGGELNLRLGDQFGRGLSPYLIVGGGYLNVLSGYDRDGTEYDSGSDRYFAIGGAGLELPLSSALRLNGGVRSLLMSTDEVEELDDLSDIDTDNVYGSWMYTAGLEFSFGSGPSSTPGDIIGRELDDLRSDSRQRDRQREQQIQDRFSQLEAQIDSLEQLAQRGNEDDQIRRLQQRIDSLGNRAQQREDDLSQQEQQEIQQLREQLREDIQQLRDQQQAGQQGQLGRQFAQQGQGDQQQGQGGQQQMQGGQQRAPISTSGLSGQTVTVPVPNQGEIYVRFGNTVDQTSVETVYGPPMMLGGGAYMPQPQVQQGVTGSAAAGGGLTTAQVQQLIQQQLQQQSQSAQGSLSEQDIARIVRETLNDQLQGMAPSDAQAAQVNALRRQISDLESRVQRRLDRLSDQQGQAPTQPSVTVVSPGGSGESGNGIGTVSTVQQESLYRRNLQAVSPLIGLRFGDETEFLVGARGDYSTRVSRLRFAPEFELGFGSGTSVNLLGNGIVPVGGNLGAGLQPYVGAGLGLASESGLSGLGFGINLLGGTQYTFDSGAVVFGEFSTLSFFDTNRFLFGYRLRF